MSTTLKEDFVSENLQNGSKNEWPNGLSHSGPKRVLFVMDKLGYSGGVSHGPAQYLRIVLPRFHHEKVSPSLCVLSPWHPFAEQLEAVNVNTIFLNRMKWDPRVLIDLITLIQREHIDVIQLFGMKACLLGRIAAGITGVCTVVHVRDMNPMGPILRFVQKTLARYTDIAFAVSNAVRVFAIEELGIPHSLVRVLHNPVVATEFTNQAKEHPCKVFTDFGVEGHAQVIGIIGRLSPEKGHKLLIQAFPSLLDRCPDAKLLVIGDGPTRNEIELLVQQLNLAHAVRFLGYRSDVHRLLKSVDVVVMPSIREGFPNAAVEAMAAGKPVVAFEVGGLPDIVIDSQTGYLVQPNDVKGLIDSLERLVNDPVLLERMSQECRESAQRFTVEKHICLLEDIYSNLAG